ncbi:MAG: type I glyceraldehyde-3-phosphate dehydrogenase [Deltaproteobacteria bacterium]|nr:type I glyceraldehyde-3-phosphate dehydrogenase [Deltaproteobacteria bacterium]
MAIRVGINGFGRIGKCVLRALIETDGFEPVIINDLAPASQLAPLLKYDSVHGTFQHDVSGGDDFISVDGVKIPVTSLRNPEEVPWDGCDVVMECTGIFKDRAGAGRILAGGAKKVIISAPAKDPDVTVVYGVNHGEVKPEHQIVSNASCTTNCLAPVAKVLLDTVGIESGQMTTIHSYTNDQNILDRFHNKDLRRARAAAMNMLPTSTGAASAVSIVLPELKGKLAGMAVRVPTPNVSLVDLTVRTSRATSVEELNGAFKAASEGALAGVLAYSDEPLVSSDYIGCAASSTVDSLSTAVVGGDLVKVLSWYDNEWGFSNRMLDLARVVAG